MNNYLAILGGLLLLAIILNFNNEDRRDRHAVPVYVESIVRVDSGTYRVKYYEWNHPFVIEGDAEFVKLACKIDVDSTNYK